MNKLAAGLVTTVVLAGVAGTSVAADAASSAARQSQQHVIRVVPSTLESHQPRPDHFFGA